MERKGGGYAHEVLMAIFFLVLVFTFYASDYQGIMPPLLMVIGGFMILGGMVVREPLLMTGGIVIFGIAIMYTNVFVK